MLTLGNLFPSFELKAVEGSDPSSMQFTMVNTAGKAGKWKVFFFYPKDFTFVCPTEITGFNDLHEEFLKRNTQIYGVSTDSEFVHMAWRRDHPELRNLYFPLLSDIRRDLSTALGVLNTEEGVCNRATYIVDEQGVIRYVSVHDLNVGRNPADVLRILDALQTGELTPCSWKKGEPVLQVA